MKLGSLFLIPHSHRFSRDRAAFTLIEILVVIAILAVLAAISIPVIGRMQRGGQTTKSINNLRQIHGMIMGFVGEHDGQFPRARYDAGADPNGNNDEFKHYWRRVIWESSQGPLGKDYAEKVKNLTQGAYSKTMWCPVQVSKNKMSKTGFLEGHGSYAINKFFFLWEDRVKEGDADARPVQEIVRGKKEPLIVAGTSNQDIGTYFYFESTNPPVGTSYDKAPWFNMAYDYGSGGKNGLALFLDGSVRLISSEDGKAMQEFVTNHKDFE